MTCIAVVIATSACQATAASKPGIVTTIAGTGSRGYSDGTGGDASFTNPYGMTTDGETIYVSDMGNRIIRSIEASSQEVSTIAGTPGKHGFSDGENALFFTPQGITIAGDSIFTADAANNLIRKIDITTGNVTTIAGNPENAGSMEFIDVINGKATEASFDLPSDVAAVGNTLYVTDMGNNLIRKINLTSGEVSTFAGNGARESEDGIGTEASFAYPSGITSDGTSLYVTDVISHLIRKIDIASAKVTTLAGSAYGKGKANGIGRDASFNTPAGLTTDGTNLYVADCMNHLIRKIDLTTSEVTTLAGTGNPGSQNGEQMSASFNFPVDITTDGSFLYICDQQNNLIRKIQLK